MGEGTTQGVSRPLGVESVLAPPRSHVFNEVRRPHRLLPGCGPGLLLVSCSHKGIYPTPQKYLKVCREKSCFDGGPLPVGQADAPGRVARADLDAELLEFAVLKRAGRRRGRADARENFRPDAAGSQTAADLLRLRLGLVADHGALPRLKDFLGLV